MEWIYTFSSAQIVAIFVLLMILAAEIGYRRGRLRTLRGYPAITTSRSIVKGSMIAMVGLLLAFSFSMSASRFEMRNKVIMNEANSIGTAWLRTGFLPEPARAQTRSLMRRLVDLRMDHWRTIMNPPEFYRTEKELDKVQNEIWAAVEQAYNASEQPVRIVPLVQAINQMIDVSAERKAAAWNHVPSPVIIILMLCITISAFLIGHSSGEAEWRDFLMWGLYLALIAMVFYIMLDLDRAASGWIRLNPAPLLDLQQSLKETPA